MHVLTTSSAQETLCLRALLAYAARCARRVQSLYLLPSDHPQANVCRSAVDTAIGLAEKFATGNSPDPETIATTSEQIIAALVLAGETRTDDRRAAYAANAAYAVIDATRDALESIHNPEAIERVVASVRIAHDSAVSANPCVEAEADQDRQRLGQLALGTFPETGQAIDPSESGPLGPLFTDPPAPNSTSATEGPAEESDPANDAETPAEQTATDENDILSPPPLDASTEKFREWLRDFKRKHTQLSRDREQLDNERLELSRQREELEWKQSTLEEERTRLREAQSLLDEERSQLQDRLQAEQDALRAEQQELACEQEAFEIERTTFRKQTDEFQDRVAELEKTAAELDAQRTQIAEQQKQIEQQQEQCQKQQERIKQDEDHLHSKRGELERKQSTLEEEQTRLRKVQSSLDEERATLQDRLQAEQDALQGQQQELACAQEAFEAERAAFDEQTNELQTRVAELEKTAAELDTQRTQIAEQQQRIEQQQEQIERDKHSLDQEQEQLENDRKRLAEALAESQHEFADAAHRREQIDVEWIRLEQNKRQILEVADLLNEERTALADRCRQDDEQRDQIKTEREKLRSERAELQTQQNELRAQFDSFQKQQNRLLEDKVECARKEAEIHKALSRLRDERKQVQKETSAAPTGEPTIDSVDPIAGLWELIGQLQQDRQELQSLRTQLTSELTQTQGKQHPETTPLALPVPVRGPTGRRSNGIHPLRILIEPGLATEMQLAELFDELSKLYRQLGGPGVRFTVTGCRTWTPPPQPDAPTDGPLMVRSFVDVRGTPCPSADVPSENIDPILWNRFLSSLLIPLVFHGDLADFYELGQPAEKNHDAGHTVSAAAHRAATAYAAHNNSALPSHTCEPGIDVVTQQFRRLETLLKRLADEQHLTAELATPDEITGEDSGQTADSSSSARHPISRRWKTRRAAIAAAVASLIAVLAWVIAG